MAKIDHPGGAVRVRGRTHGGIAMTQPQGPDFTKGPGQPGGQPPQGYGPLPGYGGPPPGSTPPPSYGPPPGLGGPTQVQPPKKPKRWPWIIGGVVLLLVVIGAVGGSKSPSRTAAPAVTTALATPAPAAPPALPPAVPTTSPQAAPSTTLAPAAPAAPVKVPMPNVVCQNLQAAQDRIQAAGVFYSRSNDATGKTRLQILDRDWIVVSQQPSPGVPIGEGDAVLSVVKITEPNNC